MSARVNDVLDGAAAGAGLDRLRAHQITTLDQLRAINGVPKESTANKETPWITPLMEEFIAKSPFFLMGTSNADGMCDVSPKGDPAGSVRVLDSRTLAIPDRLGSKRVDGFKNVLANPHVGLLFMIPNVDETLRVNGRAFLTQEPELLASLAVRGATPKLALIVEIEEAYMHCARAFLRSGLWKPETWPDPGVIPTMAMIGAEQKNLPPPDESAGKRMEEYRSRLD